MNYNNYKKEKDAYPFRVGLHKAKSITVFGMKNFGNEVGKGVSFLFYMIIKIINKVCVVGTILFGLVTIFNVFSMGISFEILQTNSFLLLAGFLIIGVISYIIRGMIG